MCTPPEPHRVPRSTVETDAFGRGIRDSKRANWHHRVVDDFISPASTMKLRVPVRGRAKNSTRKPRGGSLCVRPTPSFMPSPPARGTPSSARRRKMRTDEKITVQNPSETLRFAARVPYPFSCARRRLPPYHRPATPRWRIFFRWQKSNHESTRDHCAFNGLSRPNAAAVSLTSPATVPERPLQNDPFVLH